MEGGAPRLRNVRHSKRLDAAERHPPIAASFSVHDAFDANSCIITAILLLFRNNLAYLVRQNGYIVRVGEE